MNQVKILICGCGEAGLNVAQAAVADGRGKIVGLFDPQSEKLHKAREQYPDALSSSDSYEHLLKQTRPDAVNVAVPDHLHAEQTIVALEHGCHVLVEKPMATTVADAQQIIDVERKTGLQVMTDYLLRYSFPWGQMALAAKSGSIGKLFFVQGDYIHDMWNYYSVKGPNYTPWRVDTRNPQDILLGGGCHPIDLIQWVADVPVTEVYSYSNKLCMPEFPSDDCYVLILRFENGVLGKVFVTGGCSGGSGDGTIEDMGGGFFAAYGTEGTLWKGKLFRRGKEPVELENKFPSVTVREHHWNQSVKMFLDMVEGKIENPISAREGAKNVAICDAALRSIQSGRPERPVRF